MSTVVPKEGGGYSLTYGSDTEETRARLRELILYLAHKCKDDPTFGATKLNTLLYYIDLVSFREHGEPVTGVQYTQRAKGPAPRHLVPVREQMKADGEIDIETRNYIYPQHRVVAKRKANLDLFKPRDIALADAIIDELSGLHASEVSGLTHGIVRSILEEGELIPYEAILVSDQPLSESAIRWAQSLIQEHVRHGVSDAHP